MHQSSPEGRGRLTWVWSPSLWVFRSNQSHSHKFSSVFWQRNFSVHFLFSVLGSSAQEIPPNRFQMATEKVPPNPFSVMTFRVLVSPSLSPTFIKYLIRSSICQKVDCLCFFISKSSLQGMQSICGTSSL